MANYSKPHSSKKPNEMPNLTLYRRNDIRNVEIFAPDL